MKRYATLCLVMVLMCLGCASPPVKTEPPVPLEVIEETIQWARENARTLEQLPLKEAELEEFQRAKSQLSLAERSFAKALYDEAYLSALESLSTSQKLVQRFYESTVVSSARETKEKIEAITAEDPDSPLQEFLPVLTEILDYSEEIKTTQSDIDLIKVLAHFEHVTEVSQHAQNMVRRTVESDVSFESGQYRLSEGGKQVVAEYCREILIAKQELAVLYPERDIVIRINLAGYTDPVDFREGTNLLKQLTDGVDPATIPSQEPELRKFLNRRLSEFRVATLGDFMRECLQESEPEILLELHGIGFGEEMPPGVSQSVILSDQRRRICKVFTYILLR